ncbi:periplasmic chaperone for outer membrane proteins Skp [Acinetobacter calcoaceticus]|uniref:Periplasmic chaperone for outer membrane proteins Skp n=1 Tax=Acinetobacter calcoaceticus TaxID=471 RepID=A0A4R1XX42_ACICA|nr:periplasmic chaperone for outer membrane proteins Skp [Acinetobacter calcoaceticus]
MKKINYVLAGLALSFSSLVNAAGYGVIDLEKVVENSQYLKQQNSSLEQSVKPQTAKLEQLTKEIEALRQKAQAQGANAQQLNTQYQAKVTEFQSIQQGVQAKVQSAIQNTNKTFEARLKQAAEQLRQENSLDLVLNKNSALASDPKFDLTDKMIQKVNAIK